MSSSELQRIQSPTASKKSRVTDWIGSAFNNNAYQNVSRLLWKLNFLIVLAAFFLAPFWLEIKHISVLSDIINQICYTKNFDDFVERNIIGPVVTNSRIRIETWEMDNHPLLFLPVPKPWPIFSGGKHRRRKRYPNAKRESTRIDIESHTPTIFYKDYA